MAQDGPVNYANDVEIAGRAQAHSKAPKVSKMVSKTARTGQEGHRDGPTLPHNLYMRCRNYGRGPGALQGAQGIQDGFENGPGRPRRPPRWPKIAP
eukprot:5616351-Pyramimonas_sp.AAC.2